MATESRGRQERRKIGKEVRETVPRSALGEWNPPADRRDPVQILIDQGDDRLADLVPIRYARMLSSEFAFYRGAAAVMARDYTMIMGNLVLGAVLTLFGNLLADVCYGLADPRIRNAKDDA